jgi:hypothetical protein
MTETSTIDQIQVITVGEQGPPGAGIPAHVNAQTGTSYTFALSDNYSPVTANNSASQTYTIPSNAAVPFPNGSFIDVYVLGTGHLTLAINSDTLLSVGGALTIAVQNGHARIQKITPTVWIAAGNLS